MQGPVGRHLDSVLIINENCGQTSASAGGRQSGDYGRELSEFGLREFVNLRTAVVR
jgi:hypothetical protein